MDPPAPSSSKKTDPGAVCYFAAAAGQNCQGTNQNESENLDLRRWFRSLHFQETSEVTADGSDFSCQEAALLKGRKTTNWWPPKDIPDGESQQSGFPGISSCQNDTAGLTTDMSGSSAESTGDSDDQNDLQEWELDTEVSSVPVAAWFPELKTDPKYEEEDWDKELEDSKCNPYDAEDLHWGSLQENNLVAPGAWQAESLFNPVGHHPVPLALKPPNRIPEIGQFDDADE
ncbi:coordinator of PRMT5 and differentiation stimulator isoform X1 [Alligator mississippiensis]|uniref:coordinator of PRMT5 and differentiation stimulator isoform X1 n=1 Tax=Alligator mississippiensis TaxID=8496 RepID=UPI0006EC89C3|nr:coordinator of PRMT5 and differentiation stimulator isoform X1 [Alligator mississippiensis]